MCLMLNAYFCWGLNWFNSCRYFVNIINFWLAIWQIITHNIHWRTILTLSLFVLAIWCWLCLCYYIKKMWDFSLLSVSTIKNTCCFGAIIVFIWSILIIHLIYMIDIRYTRSCWWLIRLSVLRLLPIKIYFSDIQTHIHTRFCFHFSSNELTCLWISQKLSLW